MGGWVGEWLGSYVVDRLVGVWMVGKWLSEWM
jgi:hypothetical protein